MTDPKYHGYDRNADFGVAGQRLRTAIVTLVVTTIVIVSIFILRFGTKLPIFIAEEALFSLFAVEVRVESVRPVGIASFSMEDLSIRKSSLDLSARTSVLTLKPSMGGFRVSRIVLVDPIIVIKTQNRNTERMEIQALLDRLENVSVSISNGRVTIDGKTGLLMFSGLDAVHRRFFNVGFTTASGTAMTSGDGRGIMLSGEVTARLWVRGAKGKHTITGDVTGEGIGYNVGGYVFSGDGFSAPLKISEKELLITGFAIEGFGAKSDARDLLFSGMSARGDMRLFPLPEDPARRGVTFSDVSIDIPRTGEIALDLLDVRAGDWEVIARTEDARVTPGLIRSLGSILPGTTCAWEWGGTMTGEVRAEIDRDGDGATGRVDVSYRNLSFTSPEWTYVADGIDGALEVAWRSPEPGTVKSQVNLDARGFQALVGDVYADFTDRSVNTTFTGRLMMDSGIEDMEWMLTIPDVMRVTAAGDLFIEKNPPVGDIDLRLGVMDLGALFDLAIRDYVTSRVPVLAAGSIEGGLDVWVSVSGELNAPRIAGEVDLNVAHAGFGSGAVDISDLSMVLPFRLRLFGAMTSGEETDISPKEYGTVSLSGASIFGMEVGEAAVDLALIDNVCTIDGPAFIPVSGGELRVDAFTVTNPFSPGWEVAADFEVTEFDLAPIFASIWGLEMAGTLSGGYDSLEIREGALATSGGIIVDIASGEVEISNLWGADVFSSRRRIGMDISFEDISLEEITEPTNMGRVSGVVAGSVEDLIIAYGEPQGFVFDVRTVEKRGVPRRVSVDFVDNISILGSGTDIFTDTLNKGVNRFVGEYRYSEMGIHLELEGATFTVSGTVHDGGTEYFIKRSGPFGINVVNRNPNNSIRFRDMMTRLKRIQVESKEDIVIEK